MARCPAGLATALVVVAALSLSCSPGQTDARSSPSRSPAPTSSAAARIPGPTPSTEPGSTARPSPALPKAPARAPARLAEQLDRADATLRDPRASGGDVRRAAELHQLAVRSLARGSSERRRRVIAELDRPTAAVVRDDVAAASELRILNTPRPDWPPWHVVAPPPARDLLRYYKLAQRRTGVPWEYLAAIHLVETRMGRIRGPSTAGALGPMQFLPSTWELYGAGGDINDPRDAVLAAARLLAANGAPRHMAGALWHYNPSSHYVKAVTLHAHVLERTPVLYRGYWSWRVLYDRRRTTYVLPVGFPRVRPVPVGRK